MLLPQRRGLLQAIDHPATHAEVLAERALLRHLRAGCLAPVGAIARTQEDRLNLSAVVLSQDGQQRIGSEANGEIGSAEDLGVSLAEELVASGAAVLLER